MHQIVNQYSVIGLLTYQFEVKFKKFLLFLQTVNDPELLLMLVNFLTIKDLIYLLSTSKKLLQLKQIPTIENRILKLKLQYYEKQINMNQLNIIPSYFKFLFNQKQTDFNSTQQNKILISFYQQLMIKKQNNNQKKQSNKLQKYTNTKNIKKPSQSLKLEQIDYNNIPKYIQKQIKKQIQNFKNQNSIKFLDKNQQNTNNIYQPIKLSKEPQRNEKKQIYIEKFREQYTKMKQFQKKRNIKALQQLHQIQQSKIKIKNKIQTPFRTIPIIQIQQNDKISVVKADSFAKNSVSTIKNRFKTILGLRID